MYDSKNCTKINYAEVIMITKKKAPHLRAGSVLPYFRDDDTDLYQQIQHPGIGKHTPCPSVMGFCFVIMVTSA